MEECVYEGKSGMMNEERKEEEKRRKDKGRFE